MAEFCFNEKFINVEKFKIDELKRRDKKSLSIEEHWHVMGEKGGPVQRERYTVDRSIMHC